MGTDPDTLPPLMMGTTADIDKKGKTYNVLYWRPVKGIVSFNIYRKKQNDAEMPVKPVNSSPIASVHNCKELKAVIQENTPEWTMLGQVFSGGTGTKEKFRPLMKENLTIPHKVEYSSNIIPLRQQKNPCPYLDKGLSKEKGYLFDSLAMVNMKIRIARGLCYLDHGVAAGEHYIYELRGIRTGKNEEIVLFQDLELWAGHPDLPDAPIGITSSSGDHKVLLTWERNDYASGYAVQRYTGNSGNPVQVNEDPIVYNITKDLDNQPLSKPLPGFLDFQRWNESGDPISHDVKGVSVEGPDNYCFYRYEIASVDILGRIGNWSTSVYGYPEEKILPAVPKGLKVDSFKGLAGLSVSWNKISRNAEGHPVDIQSYQVYRSDSPDLLETVTAASGNPVFTVTTSSTDPLTETVSWTDTDSVLIADYGEKTFYYRVGCTSIHGRQSPLSAIMSGFVPDTRAPGPTHVTGTKGTEASIIVYWDPNPEVESDLAGYQIYRSVCDKGKFQTTHPGKLDNSLTSDFMLIGEVLLKDAGKLFQQNQKISFEDFSVPAASTICYAYWVRAYDFAGNLYSGQSGYPASPNEYRCGHIIKTIPPPVPVITSLAARNNEVLIKWVAAPFQDLRAFHIYRSEGENDPGKFIACIFNDGSNHNSPWTGVIPDCDQIPAIANPLSSEGSFTDTDNIIPNQEYWYRITALDWLANESENGDLLKIPASSTFTYSSDLPEKLVVLLPQEGSKNGCGLVIRWTTPPDATGIIGYFVFRSSVKDGIYRQVSPLVIGNEYTDKTAFRNSDYWYRVQAIDKEGKLSPSSDSVKHTYLGDSL